MTENNKMPKMRSFGEMHPEVTADDIGELLEQREGGRTAGRGDSPMTQERYEGINGISKEKSKSRI